MGSDDSPTVADKAFEVRIRHIDDDAVASDAARYDKVGRLGKGGMGDVELCRDTRISREVAMKVLRRSLREDPAYRARFLFEARLQGQLEHPSIVPVHDLGETPDGDLYFTMKRVRGTTLAQAIRDVRNGNGTRRRLVTAFSSVCLAVDFAHARGVVHRDLKPQNIMLGDFGEVYVLDWGIAKLLEHADTPVPELSDLETSDTRAGATLGTPLYMAPERKEGGDATPQTDVYSLGVMLGEILETDDEMPPELTAVTAKAMAADPAQRYRSAREIHDALERFLDGDRDLEARRRLAQNHAARAEAALGAANDAVARSMVARDVGRALGLDPSNTHALRILMRLLSDMPSELPPPAQAEIDRRWIARRARTMRVGAVSTLALLLTLPFLFSTGIRNWGYVAAFVGFICLSSIFQWQASRYPTRWWFAAGYCAQMLAAGWLTISVGLVGIVPACMSLMLIAWRQTVHRTSSGLLMVFAMLAALLAPFALSAAGLIPPIYEFRDGMLAIVPHMNYFPPLATQIYVITCTFGVIAAASIYGRIYVNEIRKAEAQMTFQAWQLQQLLPPV